MRLIEIPRVVGKTTITGRNQITLPAEGLRELGWERGDRLVVETVGEDTLVIRRLPENPAEYFAGKLTGVYGDHEEVLRYLDEERRSWDPDYYEAVSERST